MKTMTMSDSAHAKLSGIVRERSEELGRVVTYSEALEWLLASQAELAQIIIDQQRQAS